MTVNGAFFQLQSLTIEFGVTIDRTFNASGGGGISLRDGLYNDSSNAHTFNVPIGVDDSSVEFQALEGDLTFTENFFLNNNLAEFSGSNDITISGVASGDGGRMSKDGSGRLTLSGNNTFGGSVTIDGGVVRIEHANALGGTSTGTTVNAGAALELNAAANYAAEPLTLNGTGISSGGALRKIDDGTRQYPGAITLGSDARINSDDGVLDFRAAVDLDGHTLYLGGPGDFDQGAAAALFNNASKTTGDGAIYKDGPGYLRFRAQGVNGSITIAGGEIRIGPTGGTIIGGGVLTMHAGTRISSDGGTTRTINKAMLLEGNIGLATHSTGGLNITAPIDLDGGVRIITNANAVTVSDVISNGGLTKDGAGTLTLSAANTYASPTRVGAGTLELNHQNAIQNSTLDMASGDTGSVSFGTPAAFTLGGLAGSRNLNMGAKNLSIGNNNASTTYEGILSGSGDLTKIGTGTLTLSGANTHTGDTTVNGGTLLVIGSAADSDFTINSGGTLGGSGPIGALAVFGTVSPGQSITNLQVDTLALEADGEYHWQIESATGTAGEDWDLITVDGGSGPVTNNATSGNPFTIRIDSMSATPTGWDPDEDYSWVIVDAGSVTGFDADTFVIDDSDFDGTIQGRWSVSEDSGNIVLSYRSFGDRLVWYPFTGETNTPSNVAANVSASLFDVSAGNLTYDSANAASWQGASGVPYARSLTGWDELDQDSAKHFLFDLDADSGWEYEIREIRLWWRRTGTGPEDVGLRIDTNSIYTQALAANTTEEIIAGLTTYTNLTSAVIRIDGWGGGGGQMHVDDVEVYGFVRQQIIPNIDVLGTNGAVIAVGSTTPSLADGTDFGTVSAGNTKDHIFTLTNSGLTELTFDDVAIGGDHAGDFSITVQPTSPIDGGESDTFTLRFEPSDAGLREATIFITNNVAGKSPYTFDIQGTGAGPTLDVDPDNLTFNANVTQNPDPDEQTFDISNLDFGAMPYTNTVTYGAGASGWLTIEPLEGSVGATDTQITTATVVSASLPRGTYYATNTVNAGGAGVVDMEITLNVTGTVFGVTYDTFDYSASSVLHDQSGGQGWSANWVRNATTPELFIQADSLADFTGYCNLGGNKAALDGGALSTGDRFREAYRNFPEITNGVVYVGFKFQMDNTGSGREGGVRLMDGGDPVLWIGKVDATSNEFSVNREGGGGLEGSTYSLNNVVTYLFVTRFDLDSGDVRAKAFTAAQWATANAEEPALSGWDVVATHTAAIDRIDRLSFYAQHGLGLGESPGFVLWDDVRIAQTWHDLICDDIPPQTYPVVTNVVMSALSLGEVSDADLNQSNFPVTVYFYNEHGMRDANFVPSFEIVNADGNAVVSGLEFTSFTFTDEGRSLEASVAGLSDVESSNIIIGTHYLRWSAATSNNAYHIRHPFMEDGSLITFEVFDDDVDGPVASLLYVGPGYTEGDTNDLTVTDAQLASGGAIDIAVRWDDPSGIWHATNNYLNIFSHVDGFDRNVQPNWDLWAPGGTEDLGFDVPFTNFFGESGATSITSVHYNIDAVAFGDILLGEWELTVSAQDDDFDRGYTLSDIGDGDHEIQVSRDRAVTTNQPLSFFVIDDDTDPPVVGDDGLIVMIGSTVINPVSGDPELLAYWNFNGDTYEVAEGSGIFTSGLAVTNQWFGGTTLNALGGDPAGNAFSPQGGSGLANNGTWFQFEVDMSGSRDLVMTFAAQKTVDGFNDNQVSYSVDGGDTFTDFGAPFDPATSFALHTFDFSSETALNNQNDVIIRITIDGADAATQNNRFDNFQFNAAPIVYEITDGQLASVNDTTDPLRFSFNVYDVISGIYRGTTFDETNMHINISGIATNNTANYQSTLSSADTTVATSTSVWEFTSFDFEQIGDLYADGQSNRPVRATMSDMDADRPDDNLWLSNRLFGFVRIIDDDEDPPRVGADALTVMTNEAVLGTSDLTDDLLAAWNFNNDMDRLGANHGAGTLTLSLPGTAATFPSLGLALNAVPGDPPEQAMIISSDNNGGTFTFRVDMSQRKDLVITFAASRTTDGYNNNAVEWSLNGSDFTFFDTFEPGTTPGLQTMDFSAITDVNNQPEVYIRVTLGGGIGADAENRYDNFQFRTTRNQISLLAGWNFNDDANRLGVSHGAGSLTHNLPSFDFTTAGSSLNLVEGDAAGDPLRVSGDSNNGSNFAFRVSMGGHENLVMTFAVERSAAGHNSNQVAYSMDGVNFTDFGGAFNPDTSYSVVTRNFSAITALNNAPEVYVRVTVDGAGSGGVIRFDNFQFRADPVRIFEITDAELAGVSAGNPLRFSFNAYDEFSGIVRGTAADGTNMSVSVPGLWTENTAQYVSGLSTADSTDPAATSVWEYAAAFTPAEITDMYSGIGVVTQITANVSDADLDRPNDNLFLSNQVFGAWRVIDDDMHPPELTRIGFGSSTVASHPFRISVAGTTRSVSSAGTTNATMTLTDAELRNTDALDIRFAFGVIDRDSGVARPGEWVGGDSTNSVLNISVGNQVVGNFANFNAGLSGSNRTNAPTTNVWAFADDFFDYNTVGDMFAEGTVPVYITLVDDDNDRTDDQALLRNKLAGSLVIIDDDIEPPLMSNVNVNVSSTGTLLVQTFDVYHGWTNSRAAYGTYTNHAGSDVWWGQDVNFTPLLSPPQRMSGLRVLGMRNQGAEQAEFYLPERTGPGNLFLWARLTGAPVQDYELIVEGSTNDWADVIDYGTRVVPGTEYELLSWKIQTNVNMALRIRRLTDDSDPNNRTIRIDDITLTAYATWTNAAEIDLTWPNAFDASGIFQYRRDEDEPTWEPLGTNVTDGIIVATNEVLGVAVGEGVVTGFVFAVDNDNDRPNDRMRNAGLPYVVRIDRSPPETVQDLEATSAIDSDFLHFDDLDETTEIGIRWTPFASEAVAAGPRSDDAPLSPWSTFIVTFYEVEDTNGVPVANAVTSTITRQSAGWEDLSDWALTNAILPDLAFSTYYAIELQGRDEAGNIGSLATAIGNTDRFAVTQGVARAETKSEIFWTAPTNALGEVTREYDLIYTDAASYANALQEALLWNLSGTVSNRSLIDTNETPGTLMRFFRAAPKGRWTTNNVRPVASEEVYVAKRVPLTTNQNWVAFPGVPDSNTVARIFGTDLPEGNFPAASTRVTWYAQATNQVATQQVWLATGGDWVYSFPPALQGDPADDVTVPLDQGVVVDIPVSVGSASFLFVGRVPTNSMSQTIEAGEAFNFVSFRLPRRMHPSEMNLLESDFTGSPFFTGSDVLWRYDRDAGGVQEFIWYNTSSEQWMNLFTGAPLSPSFRFRPDDALVIWTQGSATNWTWTVDPIDLYEVPSRFLDP